LKIKTMEAVFNNPSVFVQSWYVVPLKRKLRTGEATSVEMFNRRIAVFRDSNDQLHAIDARCPHLGSDLGLGCVIKDHLRCQFHHWSFAGNGQCVDVPAMNTIPGWARVDSYPIQERYGAVWLFNGPKPLFPIPPPLGGIAEDKLRVSRFPARLFRCHPHVISCNGLDLHHFKTVHQFDFAKPPVVEVLDPYRIRVNLSIRLSGDSLLLKILRCITSQTIESSFTTYGGNMAITEAELGGFRFSTLFTFLPFPDGRSISRTFMFVPRNYKLHSFATDRIALGLAGIIMIMLLREDCKLFNNIQFQPHLVSADSVLATFIRQISALPVFDPTMNLVPPQLETVWMPPLPDIGSLKIFDRGGQ
jgi:phenylpropionate dioxygenase-like ring-hydroxylating dioxygenase large terminal subunit